MALHECLKSTAEGLASAAAGALDAAAVHWLRAAQQAAAGSLSTSLRAATENNAGIANLLQGEPHAAQARLACADALWGEVRQSIVASEVPIAGRSSVFHLRLAMEHHERFTALRRQRHLDVCDGARAIGQSNALVASQGAGAIGGDARLMAMLSSAFGPHCPEMALLGAIEVPITSVLAVYGRKAATLREARRAYPVHGAPSLLADLDLTAQMTVLVHPSLLRAQIPPTPSGADDNDGS